MINEGKANIGEDGIMNEEFSISLWWIWHWRNGVIFRDKELDSNRKVEMVRRYSNEVKSIFSNRLIMKGGSNKLITRWIL